MLAFSILLLVNWQKRPCNTRLVLTECQQWQLFILSYASHIVETCIFNLGGSLFGGSGIAAGPFRLWLLVTFKRETVPLRMKQRSFHGLL
jgi:hypothetical protein